MTDYRFSKGEYGFNLNETIQNADLTAKDLTGYTVKFCMKDAISGISKVNGTAAIAGSPTLGVVNYTVVSTDFDTVGTYNASWVLTKAGDQEETNQFKITIQTSAGP